MKKSDFEQEVAARVRGVDILGLTTEAVVRHIVAAAVAEREAAGVVWDPEEEPLPERLFISYSGGGTHAVPVDGQQIWVFSAARGVADELRQRCFLEAVRRWNAWPKLRALADCLGDDGPVDHLLTDEDVERKRRLLAILDGKEGE